MKARVERDFELSASSSSCPFLRARHIAGNVPMPNMIEAIKALTNTMSRTTKSTTSRILKTADGRPSIEHWSDFNPSTVDILSAISADTLETDVVRNSCT